MSTHNICFYGEIRKLLCGYPLLCGAMQLIISLKAPYPSKIDIFLSKKDFIN